MSTSYIRGVGQGPQIAFNSSSRIDLPFAGLAGVNGIAVDPKGDVLAEATDEQPLAWAEIHLDRKIYQPWLGDMKKRTWKERRGDLPVE